MTITNQALEGIAFHSKVVSFPQIRRWTDSAKECYLRGCNCDGCDIYKLYFKGKKTQCFMKMAVIESVRTLGLPPDLYRKQVIIGD